MQHRTISSISAADARTYTISELAREFGVTPRALRFYEDKDMLHPARDGMMRLYSNRDRARLTIIVRLKRLGLPLADIREILDLYALNDGKRAQTKMMLEKFRKQARELEVQRGDIETALTELYKGIEWLEDLVSNNGPTEETKRQAAAYEQVARKQLDEV
ncbi:MAG: MerR family transcriptional regulator [Hyphomonas sp.]|jgi:DNA-binding transcriptional MerR regulator